MRSNDSVTGYLPSETVILRVPAQITTRSSGNLPHPNLKRQPPLCDLRKRRPFDVMLQATQHNASGAPSAPQNHRAPPDHQTERGAFASQGRESYPHSLNPHT